MTREEAIKTLSLHLMQCGALMPIEWVRKNGEGSELMKAFRMAMDALRAEEEVRKMMEILQKKSQERPTNADRIRAMSDEELADILDAFSACNRCPKYGNSCFPVPNTLEWLKRPVKEDA